MSQISRYIGQRKLDEIKSRALQEAEDDFARETESERGRRKVGWLPEENWTLLWAIEYAKTKHNARTSAYTQMWRSIMEKYCPNRIDHTANTSQLFNVKKSGAFSDHMTYLQEKVKLHIEQQIDPLTTPIPMPVTILQQPSVSQPSRDPLSAAVPAPLNPTPTHPRAVTPELRTPSPSSSPIPSPTISHPPPISLHQPSSQNLPQILPSIAPSHTSDSSEAVINAPPHQETRTIGTQTPPENQSQETRTAQQQQHSPEIVPPSLQISIDIAQQDPIIDKLGNNIQKAMGTSIQEREPLRKMFQNQKFKKISKIVNDALPNLIHRTATLTEINQVHYAAALTIQNEILPQTPSSGNKARRGTQTPQWKQKLTGQISVLRAEASRMDAYQRGQVSRGLHRKIMQIKRKYNLRSDRELSGRLTQTKMLISTKAKIIKNKEEKALAKFQNRQFQKDPKRFIESLDEEKIEVKTPPSEEQLSDFWRGIYEDESNHDEEAAWIPAVEETLVDCPKMEDRPITEEEFKNKLNKTKNFKSPGPDQVTNFWMKQFTTLHSLYLAAFNRILSGEETAPLWLTEGTTTLIPKSAETQLPNKYRPICCLPTTYKLLTAIISERLYTHLNTNNLLSEQQKGCIKDTLGTKDQLLLNKAILENCRKRATNLSMAWLDYQKAYDSVPHSWIRKCLQLYGISPHLESFISESMKKWTTNLQLKHENGEIVLRNVKIKRGIFQGDSLSPLLFCLSIDPLSRLLNSKDEGYNLSPRGQEVQKIGHLLYMDDLKLYASTDNMLKNQLNTVKEFSTNITMKFGLDKCATVSIEKGKLKKKEGIDLQEYTIRALEEGQSYKYLGVEETNQIEHEKMRKLHRDSYANNLKKVLKTKLSPKNKILAINMMLIPKIQYSFGIIDWPQSEINKIDVLTRKLLAQHKIFYKDQCHARLYTPRAKGGMGLIEFDAFHKAILVSLGQYIVSGQG